MILKSRCASVSAFLALALAYGIYNYLAALDFFTTLTPNNARLPLLMTKNRSVLRHRCLSPETYLLIYLASLGANRFVSKYTCVSLILN